MNCDLQLVTIAASDAQRYHTLLSHKHPMHWQWFQTTSHVAPQLLIVIIIIKLLLIVSSFPQ
jgi:hypothetical protein